MSDDTKLKVLTFPKSEPKLMPEEISKEELNAQVYTLAKDTVTVDPIVIGYDEEGNLMIVCDGSLGVERAYFMLHQAAFDIITATAETVEEDE